jgi:hypothetical protein
MEGLTTRKLGLNTAPVLLLFPPTVGEHADPLHATEGIKFDFTQKYALFRVATQLRSERR